MAWSFGLVGRNKKSSEETWGHAFLRVATAVSCASSTKAGPSKDEE